MPLSRGEFTLEASPRSVREARHWAADACRELDRPDLVDSAELGISELVTNAILHGAPPIAVRLRGTRRYPRIEVLDESQEPPEANISMADDDELFATFGRGLGMVAMCSHAWGADLLDTGKVVWFEPAPEPVNEPDLNGRVFSKTEPVHIARPRTADEEVAITFAGFPLWVFLNWRQHFRDLRRELRLLALAHEQEYPVAQSISALFERFDAEIRDARGMEGVEEAVASGREVADIELILNRNAPALLTQIAEVLDLADAFCRDERLLSLAVTDQQRAFQEWFVGEVVRQSIGAAPAPWPGVHTVEQRAR